VRQRTLRLAATVAIIAAALWLAYPMLADYTARDSGSFGAGSWEFTVNLYDKAGNLIKKYRWAPQAVLREGKTVGSIGYAVEISVDKRSAEQYSYEVTVYADWYKLVPDKYETSRRGAVIARWTGTTRNSTVVLRASHDIEAFFAKLGLNPDPAEPYQADVALYVKVRVWTPQGASDEAASKQIWLSFDVKPEQAPGGGGGIGIKDIRIRMYSTVQ